jgi:sterol desaturase/sphingolipid hydroxylase (fatty acid hydroxylase superfamily)
MIDLRSIWMIATPAALLILLAIIEAAYPRRRLALGRHPRWITHAIFFVCNTASARALSYLFAVGGGAAWAEAQGFGLLNMTSWTYEAKALLCFIILDFAIWFQHVMMHKIPFLWAMHKVHHSDRDLDVTSALRFHPFELIVSAFYKSACVILLGVPVWVALTFELWLNCNALFNHANIHLPRRVDRILRLIWVTPDFHFTHHSAVIQEQHRNYGFALSIWDRIFGLYQTEAAAGRDGQLVGLDNAQGQEPATPQWTLMLPFNRKI